VTPSGPAIEVTDLSFRYAAHLPLALDRVRLRVGPGERCLLVGANGAGKTTLLRVIAGKHMIDDTAVRVLGRPAFHDTSLAGEVAFLGGAFPFSVDVRVGDMVDHLVAVGGADRERCEHLRRILEVDPRWHMHRISDGQRRRVQLLLGLAHPYAVLLLDEITTDLDLLARADLLAFLREESEGRAACILYATHILDRMEGWATHLAYLVGGRLLLHEPLDRIDELEALRRRGAPAPLAQLVESWLRGGGP
jgi:CCR4-NOT complex subunit CAF16